MAAPTILNELFSKIHHFSSMFTFENRLKTVFHDCVLVSFTLCNQADL